MSTRPCDPHVKAGRLAKAAQFAAAAHDVLDLADEADDVADAFVTLAVHAGIAAADVICCTRLNVYHQGDNHNDAVDLLDRADKPAAAHLRTLLGMKTRAGYSWAPVTTQETLRAQRAMDALVEAARSVG